MRGWGGEGRREMAYGACLVEAFSPRLKSGDAGFSSRKTLLCVTILALSRSFLLLFIYFLSVLLFNVVSPLSLS